LVNVPFQRILLAATLAIPFCAAGQQVELWRFDRLDKIGGHTTTILGHPRVIETPGDRAIQFSGIDDALFVNNHPLAGATRFTWEVEVRPDRGGAPEQRFFHLQEQDPKTGLDTATRLLFETRIVENRWCLDSYANSPTGSKVLIDRQRLHSLGEWHHIAMVYDGKEFRHYVDGVLQGAATVQLSPQGEGRSSMGVRINLVDYFKGAIRMARMTRGVLAPEAFRSSLNLPVPKARN
jgi:hypothetical protein